MSAEYFAGVIVRDLKGVRRELEAYPGERDIWRLVPGIANSAGTLALHLAGNLQYYIGAVLGGTGYVRDRDAEFGRRDVARSELVGQIEAALAAVPLGLGRVSEAALAAEYPERVAGVTVTLGEFLVHLVAHLGYHLGQIDYHRRLVTGRGETVGALAIAELRTAHRISS
ncbi:MAG: DinB family protein [Gemmatimonadales bacterium]